MGIKTIKVLRTVSKIVLLVIILGLLGWGGYYVYRSIAFKPQNIVVTNITDSSATITWTTSSQMNGVVYYKKDTSVLPGPLGIIGSQVAYDDRDVSDAQTACVNEFNKNAGETKDENFSVSGENFDCENARVTGMGKYYTHSVTIKNLDPESTYYFSMGDGIWSFKSDVSSVETFSLLEGVAEPMPIFGRVVGDDGSYSRDGLVYITFRDGSEEKDSVLYSSTTSDDGGWYLDASSIRDSNGDILPLELGNDTFRIKAKYSNYGESAEEKHVFGYFEVTTFDVVVTTKSIGNVQSLLNKFVLSVYATSQSCPNCPSWMTEEQVQAVKNGTANCDDIGYGNCLKVFAGDDKILDETEAKEIEENGDSTLNGELDYIAGAQNMSNYCNSSGEYCVVNSGCVKKPKKCGQPAEPPTSCTGNDLCDNSGDCEIVAQGAYRHCSSDGEGCYRWKTNTTACSTDKPKDCTYEGVKYSDGEECGDSGETCKDGTCSGAGYVTCGSEGASCSGAKGAGVCVFTDKNAGTLGCDYYQGDHCTLDGGRAGNKNAQGSCIALDTKCDIVKAGNGCTVVCPDGTVNLNSANSCEKIYSGYKDEMEDGDTVTISISEIDPWVLSQTRIKSLITGNAEMKTAAIYEMKTCVALGSDGTSWKGDGCEKICEALGGKVYNSDGKKKKGGAFGDCKIEGESILSSIILKIFDRFVQRTLASETEDGDTYSFYLPETGLYSFEIGGGQVVTSNTSDGTNVQMFYIESNGKEGFQPPADFDNPTADEDIVLSENAYQISYEQETTAQEYNIEEGINIVSFDFVPTSTDAGAYMASDVIAQASENGVNVKYISTFDGGRWYEAYSCTSDTCTGTDFSIVPGRGYLIYANNAGTITIPGYNLKSSIPVAFSSGWNLVGIHGYTTAYTARTLIDSINAIDGLTANNVSWWPTSKGKYEGLQVENSTEYGLDFAISPTNGYFVRISEYTPTDSACKSILWNDGGTLNGTCGNTK